MKNLKLEYHSCFSTSLRSLLSYVLSSVTQVSLTFICDVWMRRFTLSVNPCLRTLELIHTFQSWSEIVTVRALSTHWHSTPHVIHHLPAVPVYHSVRTNYRVPSSYRSIQHHLFAGPDSDCLVFFIGLNPPFTSSFWLFFFFQIPFPDSPLLHPMCVNHFQQYNFIHIHYIPYFIATKTRWKLLPWASFAFFVFLRRHLSSPLACTEVTSSHCAPSPQCPLQ